MRLELCTCTAYSPRVGLMPSTNTRMKYIAFNTSPMGIPSLAHSLLVIPSFPAEMILGMFPGINMPPDMSRPYKAALIWLPAGREQIQKARP